MEEAKAHPHMRARQAFLDIAGIVQPAPAPRFSRTVPDAPNPPETGAGDLASALAGWLSEEEIAAWGE
jgi:crotonobetainyl-CoA:carnitine CoA-transferase CaiB-like acyl-CoA transferase